jgi:hypothetical protein
MRKANSEIFVRKVRAEKACTKAEAKAETQKIQIMEQTEKKVVRMRKQWKLDTAVAVSNATVEIKGNLQRSLRKVKGLQHHFKKSEV